MIRKLASNCVNLRISKKLKDFPIALSFHHQNEIATNGVKDEINAFPASQLLKEVISFDK